MSWSLVSEAHDSGGGVAAKTLTGINNGDALFYCQTGGSQAENYCNDTDAPGDDKGNVYTPVAMVTSDNEQIDIVYMAVHAGSSGVSVQITGTAPSAFQRYCAFALRHSAGSSANPPILLGAFGEHTSGAAGTDTVKQADDSSDIQVASYGTDAVLIGIHTDDGSGPAIGLGTGFTTILQDTGAPGWRAEYKALSAPGTYVVNFSPAGLTVGCTFAIALGIASDFPGYTQQEFPVSTANDDGGGYRNSATWAGIASGTFSDDPGNTVLWVSRTQPSSGNFFVDEAFIRVNTGAVIPANAVILWARLGIVVNQADKSSGEDFDIAVEYYDFGGAPTVAADWDGNSNRVSAIPRFQHYYSFVTARLGTAVQYFPFNDLSGIKKSGEANAQGFSGYTGLRLKPSRPDGGSSTPTVGNTQWNFRSIENSGGTQAPFIEIGWYVPSTGPVAGGGYSVLQPPIVRAGSRTSRSQSRGLGRR